MVFLTETTNEIITVLLLALMGISAFMVVQLRTLFSVIIFSSIFTLLAAGVYITMDAVDVAFTEAAVGAGVSAVFGLGTLAVMRYTSESEAHREALPFSISLPSFFVCVILGSLLIYASFDMPNYGDPLAPIHHHVGNYYLTVSYAEMKIDNVVTSILGGYRSLDTLGETTVVFTAACCVLIIIGAAKRRKEAIDIKSPLLDDDDAELLDPFVDDDHQLELLYQKVTEYEEGSKV